MCELKLQGVDFSVLIGRSLICDPRYVVTPNDFTPNVFTPNHFLRIPL